MSAVAWLQNVAVKAFAKWVAVSALEPCCLARSVVVLAVV